MRYCASQQDRDQNRQQVDIENPRGRIVPCGPDHRKQGGAGLSSDGFSHVLGPCDGSRMRGLCCRDAARKFANVIP
ncbi:hypothetical protein, partial [Bradyrhizobium sp.]|uniref:hypothetical protein n=1 Tax=Bradyrhizobium sp. TaxID=376 RepID=UPI0027200676